MSYNSTGFNIQRAEFITDLVYSLGHKNFFLSIQEHFLMARSVQLIDRLLPDDLCVYSVAAFKEDDIRRGRGKGGLSMIWPKSIDKFVTRIPIKSTNRVQACLLKFPSTTIIWLNTYFPTDPQLARFDDTEVSETFAAIKSVINGNAHDQIIFQGDLNIDLNRNTKFVEFVRDALYDLDLKSIWTTFPIDFTFCSPTEATFSTIDHFAISEGLENFVNDAGVLHLGDNVSGHSPIYMKLNLGAMPLHAVKPMQYCPRQNWNKATLEDKDDFKNAVSECLSSLSVPNSVIQCHDLGCTDPAHRIDIDLFTRDLIMILENCAADHIPYNRPKSCKPSKRRKIVPGWVELVQPQQEKARFWYQIWHASGKPSAGEVNNIMKFTRNQYRYARRKCLRAVEASKRERFTAACLKGDKDMFKELNKIKNSKSIISSKIDGLDNPDEIADHFAHVYQNIYNREANNQPLQELLDEVQSNCNSDHLKDIELVTERLIRTIVKEKLKSSKTDPEFDLTTDAFKNSPDRLYDYLALMFRTMLIHGFMSEALLYNAIIPLIKDKNGKLDDSNNYRGIALSSLFLKIFDWLLLIIFDANLKCDQNQFGFESGSSTSMCSWTVVEVVNYFSRKGSPVYAALLDYRKAFDLVNHVKMFQNLIGRGINLAFVRLLVFVYLNQQCYIKWQSSRSFSFGVTNGTRQGSIFSPRGGFNTYLDPMIAALRNSGFGCTIGTHFFGAVAYADDVLIMTTSVHGLQKMVNICENHAKENCLKFSTDPDPVKSKTMCIAFNCENRKDLAPIKLNGDDLPWVIKAKHIGNVLHENGSTDTDIRTKKGIFIQNAMELNQEFFGQTTDERYRLNLLYNSHFSGSNIWRFESKEAQQLISSWNKNIKLIYDLPWATHRWIIESITGNNLKCILFSRFVKFIDGIHRSNKPSIKFLYKLAASDVRSVTGSNLRSILVNTGLHVVPNTNQAASLRKATLYSVPVAQEWKIPLIHSLLEVQAGKATIGFDEDEANDDEDMIKTILNEVCTA